MKWDKVGGRLRTSIVLVVMVALVVASGLIPRRAAADGAGQAFSIAPPLLNLQAQPGQTVVAQIQLTNISTTPMVMTAQANDFAAKDENGDPQIILNTSQTVPYSLRNWIQLPGSFTLAAKQTKTLSVPIVVPQNGEPGGHYAVIRFTGATPGTTGNSVSLSASIGTLVLLEVSGNVQERASLASFYTTTPSFAQKAFFQEGPIGFVTRVSDDGNTHLQPTGTITVKNIFGTQIASMRVNGIPGNTQDAPKNVLPSSIRRFDVTLADKHLFGRYTAHLDLAYGDQSKHLTADFTFWVIPLDIVIPVILGLLIIVLGLKFGLKHYNAHIIKKAQQHSKSE